MHEKEAIESLSRFIDKSNAEQCFDRFVKEIDSVLKVQLDDEARQSIQKPVWTHISSPETEMKNSMTCLEVARYHKLFSRNQKYRLGKLNCYI